MNVPKDSEQDLRFMKQLFYDGHVVHLNPKQHSKLNIYDSLQEAMNIDITTKEEEL